MIAALVDAGERHDLPLDELRVYMRSMRVDCGPVRIATREELDRYMDGSAGAVGRVMAPLLGSPDPQDVARLGVAFQLTNFIRDVREDWELDRVYLPGIAGGRPRVRAGGGGGARARSPRRSRGRASCSRGPPSVPDACERARAAGHAPGPRGLRARARPRRGASASTSSAAGADLHPWEVARAAVGGLRR